MDPQIEALRSRTRSLINDTRQAVVLNDAPTSEVILEYTEVVNLVLQQFEISSIRFRPPQSELELKVMELTSNRLLYGPPTGGGSPPNGVVPGGPRNDVVGCNGSLVLGIVILCIALLVSYLRGE